MGQKISELTDILITLRDSLMEAEKDTEVKGFEKRIQFKSAQVELKGVVKKSGTGELDFHLVGGDFSGNKETISSVKITLTPPQGMGSLFYSKFEPENTMFPKPSDIKDKVKDILQQSKEENLSDEEIAHQISELIEKHMVLPTIFEDNPPE